MLLINICLNCPLKLQCFVEDIEVDEQKYPEGYTFMDCACYPSKKKPSID